MAARGAWIAGLGMITPIGGCAAQTMTSFRGGISGYAESSILNRRFSPVTMALVPEDALPPLEPQLAVTPGLPSRITRMVRLAAAAFEDLAGPDAGQAKGLPLFVALPEAPPPLRPPADDRFLDHLFTQTGAGFDRLSSVVFADGRAGGMRALEAGLDALDRSSAQVLVGGVDTYLDLMLLATLDQQGRLLAEGVMDGFCPGEGAAFLRLVPEAKRPAAAAGFVYRPGLADEPGHRYSEQTYKGDGLGEAVRIALETVKTPPARTVFAGFNGESLFAKEWGVAYLRNSGSIVPSFRIEHPADLYGDLGAATAPVLIGLAALGTSEGHLPGPALVFCSSDGPLRGAARIGPDPA